MTGDELHTPIGGPLFRDCEKCGERFWVSGSAEWAQLCVSCEVASGLTAEGAPQ